MTNYTITCTACLSEIKKRVIYTREKCPVVNNLTFHSAECACFSKTGTVALTQCPKCGFVFNCLFDESKILYNESYNNSRSNSHTYLEHLDHLVDICSSWIKPGKTVLEIGCGKGDFLKKLSNSSGCYGIGYDTSYEGEERYGNLVSFHKKYFKPQNSEVKYDALILRHMLEHIAEPFSFLMEIYSGNILKPGAYLLLEVPDLAWIIKNKTFYDITYEHCNYFYRESITRLLTHTGWEIKKIDTVYGDQYLLVQGKYINSLPAIEKEHFIDTLVDIDKDFNSSRKDLFCEIEKAETICVWGASGKGVIFLSQLPDSLLDKIKFVIDIDPAKQDRFLPVTGKQVYSPSALKEVTENLLVIVMNDIYSREITEELYRLGVEASVISCMQ